MNRRKFIKNSALASSPLLLNHISIQAMGHRSLFDHIALDNDKILVLIELNGGNDGLNSFIPLDYYSNLVKHRPNLIIPEDSLLNLTDSIGLHPKLEGLKDLYDNDQMALIQNVGYQNQNRSHFRSRDIWTSSSDADEVITTGWLGRYLSKQHSNYPDNYPNTEFPDPIALTIGALVSETCQGIGSNFSLAINDVTEFAQLNTTQEGVINDSLYGKELKFLINAIQQTNAYNTVLSDAYDKGDNLSNLYIEETNDNKNLAGKLKIIARMIAGGLRTKIYVASLGGFDTHSNQANPNNTVDGDHAQLLEILSNAIAAFQDDLKRLGVEEKVVGMTFSEFGRQIQANGSDGTDHGNAAPMIVFGNCVGSTIIGDNPQIENEIEEQAGVPMQFDFRSVYGSVLMDWFAVEESVVKDVLMHDFEYLPIIQNCAVTNTSEEIISVTPKIDIFPNPLHDYGKLQFELSKATMVKVSLFNVEGKEIDVIVHKRFDKGKSVVEIPTKQLVPNQYFVQLHTGDSNNTVSFIKA